MTKAELISKIAQEADVTKSVAAEMLKAFLDAIKDEMIRGGSIVFPGFGSFKVVERAGRTAKNLHTGDTIDIPAHNVVKFKVSKSLKDEVAAH